MNAHLVTEGAIPVVTFLSNFLIGGTERQVVNLVRNHDRARFEVHLACFRKKGPLLDELDPAAIQLSEYPITTLPSIRTFLQQWRFASYLKSRGARILHSFGFYANVFAIPAGRLAGVDVIVASIRDTGDHLSWWQKAMQKWVCRGADLILVNAEAVKESLLRQGYAPGRIAVIPNGIDVARFDRISERRIRAEFGVPENGSLVTVFARLNRLKGIEYFLEAAASVSRRLDDARFLVVGDSISDVYRRELEDHARRLGVGSRVSFAGFRNDVPEILAETTVSVLPSLSEGLSNVVLEAMAAGVPVVATAVGGTAEMIDDGVSGLLVPPRDPAALAKAIESLLLDAPLRQRVAKAARERVGTEFSLAARVRETERLYDRLLAAPGPSRSSRGWPARSVPVTEEEGR